MERRGCADMIEIRNVDFWQDRSYASAKRKNMIRIKKKEKVLVLEGLDRALERRLCAPREFGNSAS
jgi:hypothetical protein